MAQAQIEHSELGMTLMTSMILAEADALAEVTYVLQDTEEDSHPP